jgi:hypothetical protein
LLRCEWRSGTSGITLEVVEEVKEANEVKEKIAGWFGVARDGWRLFELNLTYTGDVSRNGERCQLEH